MHSRREDAFKEGLGGIQEELMRTNKKSRIVLYYIDSTGLTVWVYISFHINQIVLINVGILNRYKKNT